MKWKASYVVGGERKEEQGMIADLTGSDPPETVAPNLSTHDHDRGSLIDSAPQYPDAMAQNLPLRANDWHLQDPILQYAIDRMFSDSKDNDPMEIDDERSSAVSSGDSPRDSEHEMFPSLGDAFNRDESWSSRV